MSHPESTISLTAICEEGHIQELHLDGAMGRAWAESLAGLMDGSSNFFIRSPRGDDSSLIGKCGICGSQINCKVSEPVDRNARELVSGRPVADGHREIVPETGMQKDYVVLSEQERGKGFVRPVRRTYIHAGINPVMSGCVLVKAGQNGCGQRTTMAPAIAETYARDPGFYSGTFCSSCREHRSLEEFIWEGTEGQQVGS